MLITARKLHPKSAIDGQNLSRKLGGRGIIDICNLRPKQIVKLLEYFQYMAQKSPMHQAVVQAYCSGYTPVTLSRVLPNEAENQDNENNRKQNTKMEE